MLGKYCGRTVSKTFILVILTVMAGLLISPPGNIRKGDESVPGEIYNHVDGIPGLRSSALPSFSERLFFTTSANITSFDVCDFRPQFPKSHELLVGLATGTLKLAVGPAISATEGPFSAGAWVSVLDITVLGTYPIRAGFAVHMFGLSANRTDIYALNSNGDQYYMQHSDAQRFRYRDSTEWNDANNYDNQTDPTMFIWHNDTSAALQTEMGGLYNLRDEIVVGQYNGNLVLVKTENVTLKGIDFQEFLISNDFSTPILDLDDGDLDNDGNNDIVAAVYGSNVYVFKNDGTPLNGEWTYNAVNPTSITVRSVAVADLDSDGLLDIIGGTDGGELYVWHNDGSPFTGTFTAYLKNDLNVGINDIKTADMDADGDVDIVCGLANGSIVIFENRLHVAVGESSSSPFSTDAFPQLTINPASSSAAINFIELSDMDFDADIDIVAAFADGDVVGFANGKSQESKTNEFVFGPAQTVGTNPYSSRFKTARLGDLDNDGDLDIVVASYLPSVNTNGTIIVYKNPGYTDFINFSSPHNWDSYVVYSKTNSFIYDLQLYDLDNDGYLDIFFLENRTYVRGIRNPGNPWQPLWSGPDPPVLADAAAYFAPSSEQFYILDFDSDGYTDIIWFGMDNLYNNGGNITAFSLYGNPWSEWTTVRNISSNPFNLPISKAYMDYFTDDNYRDIVFMDTDGNIVLVDSRVRIPSMLIGCEYDIILNTSGGSKAGIINTIDFDLDRIPDVAFQNIGTDGNLHVLRTYRPDGLLNWQLSWTDYNRSEFDYPMYGLVTADFNRDGISDYVYWSMSYLYLTRGNRDSAVIEQKIFLGEFPSQINDIITGDIDGDGDTDMAVITSGAVYFMPNRMNDDIYAPLLTASVNPKYSADFVTVTVTSNETLYAAPRIYIYGGNNSISIYDDMTPSGSLTWTYVYNIDANGTYFVEITGVDLYGNVGNASEVFFGDKILPDITVAIHGPMRDGYTNGKFTIEIHNYTDCVKDDKIGINFTRKSGGLLIFDYIPYNSSVGAFIKTYDFVNASDIYYLGINVTDPFGVDYKYYNYSFVGDVVLPYISVLTEPTDGRVYIGNKNLMFSGIFSEKVIDVIFWVTDMQGNMIGDKTHAIRINYYGNITVDSPFSLETGTRGNLILHIGFYDIAGNYNELAVSITIITFPPVQCNFHFIDPTTGEAYINRTSSRIVWIAWGDYPNINATYLRIKINDGNFSEEIPIDSPKRTGYPIDLGEKGGLINVTVRFYNEDDYTDVVHTILYEPQTVGQFPWYIFVLAAVGIAIGVIMYKVIQKSKERGGWKKYLETDLDNL